MEIFIAIAVFVAFSVITDVIEGQKKKNRPIPTPQPRRMEEQRPEIQAKKSRSIVIPEIKSPEKKPALQYSGAEKVPSAVEAVVFSDKQGEMSRAFSLPVEEKNKLQPADIHSDVLIHAVAYAQILQPPKAYQYMATRSCRGDWGNQK